MHRATELVYYRGLVGPVVHRGRPACGSWWRRRGRWRALVHLLIVRALTHRRRIQRLEGQPEGISKCDERREHHRNEEHADKNHGCGYSTSTRICACPATLPSRAVSSSSTCPLAPKGGMRVTRSEER